MAFKVIETQEELDAVIGERLSRERKSFENKYKDYKSPDDVAEMTAGLNQQIADLNTTLEAEKTKAGENAKTIEDLNAKIKGYETAAVKSRIAREVGLPYEIASRISGETEEEIKEDAENLAKVFKGSKGLPPAHDPETPPADPKKTALLKTLKSIKGE